MTAIALSAFMLDGQIRHYPWGSLTAIPELLGLDPTGEPAAELWFGAHTDAPSRRRDTGESLTDLIAADPKALLGPELVNRFGARLPFLLKVLAAAEPLSLQVHPTTAQAEDGFADETARGIALASPERSYRDPSHKPELLCALTDFEALCGFRPVPQTLQLFDALALAELAHYRALLTEPGGLRTCITMLHNLTPPASANLVSAVAAACASVAADGGAWAEVALRGARLAAAYPGDVGVVIALLLNFVTLRPGQAIYLAAGQIHAYLRGVGVEIMASSDNVLRCGLTVKHVDVDEVLRITQFDATVAVSLEADADVDGWSTFATPAADFRLAFLNLAGDSVAVRAAGAEILLCTAGEAQLSVASQRIAVNRGEAVFLPAGQACVLAGKGTVFRAHAGIW